jgi:hypothetical protein
MITSTNVPPLELVQNSMVGYGIQILSVTSQGNTTAFGPFTGTGSTIGFNDGLILTTGTALWGNGPVGPNNSPSAGIDNGTGGYGLLSNIVTPTSTFNATVFEINFIPAGDSIFFTFVFGSEEYKEYVGSEYNDVFGFFLTGPDPLGPAYADKNIALIPGSSTPVTINNVNHLTNSQYYVDNENPSPGTYTQYDGYTIPIIVRAAVIPDSTYTLKIAIADVGDARYDSGVLIKLHSFTSGEYIGIETQKTNSFRVYPNPANDFVVIRSNNNDLIETVTITDLTGKIIRSEIFATNEGKINIEDLNSGLYILTISSKSGTNSQKLVVQ